MFKFQRDDKTNKVWVETTLQGQALLGTALLNKGTAFSYEERLQFGLLGKLPVKIETLEEQIARAYVQYKHFKTDLQKNIYLASLYERNETLFYALVTAYTEEMLPIIYTPIIGEAVKTFSREFRAPRGLYISYPDREKIKEILQNRTHPDCDLVVVSDAEGILGLGDQGICGMDVPIAKLKVYTLFGGVKPGRSLPILLDVGTNNEALLNDPLYLGWRHPRIQGKEYDDFIDAFVSALCEISPQVFLHWEDFSCDNGHKILKRYRDELCTFNDDIQGTGAVTLAALLSACDAKSELLTAQRIVIYGAGNAGVGIADRIVSEMIQQGLSLDEARARFWLIDKNGLLFEDTAELKVHQKLYARKKDEKTAWKSAATKPIDLLQTLQVVKPTVLIGCSAQTGAFNKTVVKKMLSFHPRPVIMPLSNPTANSEAHPEDLIKWTKNQAFIATGSPYGSIQWRKKRNIAVAQCNNLYIFPGIGLGVAAVKAKRLSESMIHKAIETLSLSAPVRKDPMAPLLPPISEARSISLKIATAVAEQAYHENLTELDSPDAVRLALNRAQWEPHYLPLKRACISAENE